MRGKEKEGGKCGRPSSRGKKIRGTEGGKGWRRG